MTTSTQSVPALDHGFISREVKMTALEHETLDFSEPTDAQLKEEIKWWFEQGIFLPQQRHHIK